MLLIHPPAPYTDPATHSLYSTSLTHPRDTPHPTGGSNCISPVDLSDVAVVETTCDDFGTGEDSDDEKKSAEATKQPAATSSPAPPSSGEKAKVREICVRAACAPVATCSPLTRHGISQDLQAPSLPCPNQQHPATRGPTSSFCTITPLHTLPILRPPPPSLVYYSESVYPAHDAHRT